MASVSIESKIVPCFTVAKYFAISPMTDSLVCVESLAYARNYRLGQFAVPVGVSASPPLMNLYDISLLHGASVLFKAQDTL